MLNDKCISHFACSITLVRPMRYLVLTDIHANLEALEACIADATARGYDRARQSRQGRVRPRTGRGLQLGSEKRGALDVRSADAGASHVARVASRRSAHRVRSGSDLSRVPLRRGRVYLRRARRAARAEGV